jgi:8-oxo-dGTP pyrophosphatase MutT (NUDIX family)
MEKIEFTDKTPLNQKIGCICMVPRLFKEKNVVRYLAIKCKKGRGIIMPGGKWEPGERYTETAIRELEEETGLVGDPKDLQYVWMGPDGDGYMVIAFKLPYGHLFPQEPIETSEGKPGWVEKKDFLNSKYAAYYECLFHICQLRI